LNYPTDPENANLGRIKYLKQSFPGFQIGYSDHTRPTANHEVQIAAWLTGAEVIEKHFTLDKSLTGNDHYHSYDSKDLIAFIAATKSIFQMMSYSEDRFLSLQLAAREQARRGLYFTRDIKAGTEICPEDLISLRPVGATPASDYLNYCGRILSSNVAKGDQPKPQDFRV
jgi:N-acetylneuraminate synthase